METVEAAVLLGRALVLDELGDVTRGPRSADLDPKSAGGCDERRAPSRMRTVFERGEHRERAAHVGRGEPSSR